MMDARAITWPKVGLLFLLASALGLAGGMFPEAIAPTHEGAQSAPVPALQGMLAAQTLFILLAYPVALLRRRCRGGETSAASELLSLAVEALVLVLSAAPLYLAGAYLANATIWDTAAGAGYVLGLFPIAWAASAVMAGKIGTIPIFVPKNGARPCFPAASSALTLTMLALSLLALGLPMACYIIADFVTPAKGAGTLADIAPLTACWQSAAARSAGTGLPVWAYAVYPLAGLAVMLLARRQTRGQ